MGQISIRKRHDLPSQRAVDYLSPERAAAFSDGELYCHKRRFFPEGSEELELFEIEFDPNSEVQAHAHSSSEIIYVTRGELILGSQTARPGTAIFIDADTLYGFRVGPEGAAFLNFRGTPKPEYYTKDQLLEKLRAAKAGH